MKSRSLVLFAFGGAAVFAALHLNAAAQQKLPVAAAKQTAPPMTADAQSALIAKYCATCHNDKVKAGNMSLAQFDVSHPETTPELVEKIIRKTRVGLMPKPGSPRPDTQTLRAFAESLEIAMDRAAALHP